MPRLRERHFKTAASTSEQLAKDEDPNEKS
jgi:hypothetical protein